LYSMLGPDRFKAYTSHGKSYIAARDRLVQAVRDVIKNRRNSKETHHDLLQYCIESSGDDGKIEIKYTEDELLHDVMLFFVAGYETTANLLAWSLYYLSKNPNIKNKVLEELREANAPTDESVPTWSLVNNLPYMTQVLKETLRLHPALAGFGRQLINDEKYKDLTLPAGTLFFSQSYSIQRDLRHYPCSNVDEFNPDHFLPEKIKSRHPYAWVPFAAGLRNCIGMQFALVEARTVLAYLLPRFEFIPTTEARLRDRGVLTSENMKMILQPI